MVGSKKGGILYVQRLMKTDSPTHALWQIGYVDVFMIKKEEYSIVVIFVVVISTYGCTMSCVLPIKIIISEILCVCNKTPSPFDRSIIDLLLFQLYNLFILYFTRISFHL